MDSIGFKNIKKKLRLNNQGISDVMGVRLRTVQNWASGVWEMTLMADKFLRVLKNNQTLKSGDTGYKAGYNRGYINGANDMKDDYRKGYRI